jgi:hypothetical protein
LQQRSLRAREALERDHPDVIIQPFLAWEQEHARAGIVYLAARAAAQSAAVAPQGRDLAQQIAGDHNGFQRTVNIRAHARIIPLSARAGNSPPPRVSHTIPLIYIFCTVEEGCVCHIHIRTIYMIRMSISADITIIIITTVIEITAMAAKTVITARPGGAIAIY